MQHSYNLRPRTTTFTTTTQPLNPNGSIPPYSVVNYNSGGTTGDLHDREHVIPKKALEDAGWDLTNYYNTAPTVVIPRTIHRTGLGEGIGRIPTTGSGKIADYVVGEITTALQGQRFAEALEIGLNGNIGAHIAQSSFNANVRDAYANYVMAWYHRNDISKAEAENLVNRIGSTWLRHGTDAPKTI